MMVSLNIPAVVFKNVRQHLLPRCSRKEQAAFVFAKTNAELGTSLAFDFVQWEPLTRGDFDHQSPYHLELHDDTRQRVIKRAHDLQCSLIEFHSHPGPSLAQFSTSDFAGFKEFVPHVLWRLKGRPYAAVVVAPSGFDALAWTSPLDVVAVDALVLDRMQLHPTGLSFNAIRKGIAWNV